MDTKIAESTILKARIEEMKRTRIIWLPAIDKFWHFIVVWILLVIPVIKTYELIFNRFHAETFKSLFWGGYFWVIPAVSLYFLQKRRLKFTEINIDIDDTGFKTAVEQTAKQMKWSFQFVTNDLVLAKLPPNWKSWGHHITILRTPQSILFNSISEPNRITLVSWGKNQENLKIFESYIYQVKAGLL